MIARPAYTAPRSLETLRATLDDHGPDAKLLAGGTDLLVQMRARTVEPTVLVDLKRLDLAGIHVTETRVQLGALATHADLVASRTIRARFPALAAACGLVGGPTIRNRGTIGGNLVNGSPAADAVPPLMAYEARITIDGPAGEREVAADAFYRGYRTTCLEPGELVTRVSLPVPALGSTSSFIKGAQRRALAISGVNVAVALRTGADGLQARVALGSVGPTVVRARSVEAAVRQGATCTQAAALIAEDIAPISDLRAGADYRLRLATTLTRRLLTQATEELHA